MLRSAHRHAAAVTLVFLVALSGCGSRRSEHDLAAATGRVSTDEPAETVIGMGGGGEVSIDGVVGADGDLAAGPADTSTGSAEAAGDGAAVAEGGTPGAAPDAEAVPQTGGPRPPLIIGSVGSISGLVGNALKPGVDGLRVWVQWINSRGGLNGHPVELIVADDRGDPARHRSLIQELVEQRGVVAFVQNAEALTGAGSVSFHQDRRIPVIGSEGSNQYWNENSMYFPQMSHGSHFVLATFAANATWATEHGFTRYGQLVCTEAASCRAAVSTAQKHASNFGLELVYSAEASMAKPDYTAECLNAQRAGVEVFAMGFEPNGISRVAAACARQGFFPVYLIPSASYGAQHLNDSNMRQVVVNSPVAPYGSAVTAEMQEAFARFAPDVHVTVSHVEGWTAGKLLERAAQNLQAPTTEAILEGLWTIRNEDLNGLTAPIVFNRDAPATPVTCWFLLEAGDGRLEPYRDGERRCTDIPP